MLSLILRDELEGKRGDAFDPALDEDFLSSFQVHRYRSHRRANRGENVLPRLNLKPWSNVRS